MEVYTHFLLPHFSVYFKVNLKHASKIEMPRIIYLTKINSLVFHGAPSFTS